MIIRVHVYYSGMVHGVGFRFTAEREAAGLGLTGWVKNLADGRVEVIAEGDEAALNKFLEMVKKSMGRYINDIDIEWQEAAGKFSGFEIKF